MLIPSTLVEPISFRNLFLQLGKKYDIYQAQAREYCARLAEEYDYENALRIATINLYSEEVLRRAVEEMSVEEIRGLKADFKKLVVLEWEEARFETTWGNLLKSLPVKMGRRISDWEEAKELLVCIKEESSLNTAFERVREKRGYNKYNLTNLGNFV